MLTVEARFTTSAAISPPMTMSGWTTAAGGLSPKSPDTTSAPAGSSKTNPTSARYAWKSVEKADVQSLAEIGSLETIFECLGGIKCHDLHGTKRFRVDQVLAALQHPSCTDRAMLASITQYKILYGQGKLNILITLFDCAEGIIVCDGNKRMVACLEHTKEQGIGSLVLPVFIVSAK
jgi:hypothetical protein